MMKLISAVISLDALSPSPLASAGNEAYEVSQLLLSRLVYLIVVHSPAEIGRSSKT